MHQNDGKYIVRTWYSCRKLIPPQNRTSNLKYNNIILYTFNNLLRTILIKYLISSQIFMEQYSRE